MIKQMSSLLENCLVITKFPIVLCVVNSCLFIPSLPVLLLPTGHRSNIGPLNGKTLPYAFQWLEATHVDEKGWSLCLLSAAWFPRSIPLTGGCDGHFDLFFLLPKDSSVCRSFSETEDAVRCVGESFCLYISTFGLLMLNDWTVSVHVFLYHRFQPFLSATYFCLQNSCHSANPTPIFTRFTFIYLQNLWRLKIIT